MAKFKYQERTKEALQKRSEQRATKFDSPYKDGVQLYKAVDGENAIRILPPTWDNAEHYGIDVYFHYGIGEDQQTYICPSKMGEGDCPICIEAKTIKPKTKEDEELLKQLKPGKRVLVWIIDRNNEEAGPMLYPMPWTMDKDISAASIDSRTGEILHVDSPDSGFDIFFSKQGTGITTKYNGIRIDRRESPLHSDNSVVNEWLAFVSENPITSIYQVYSFDTIDRAFSGKVSTKNNVTEKLGNSPADRKAFGDRMSMRSTVAEVPETDEDTDEVEEDSEVVEEVVSTGRGKLAAGVSTLRSGKKG